MAVPSCGSALLGKFWQPVVQTVRYGRRINIKHPRPPHYEKARLIALCKPIYAPKEDKSLLLSEKCKKKEEEDMKNYSIDNPYENLLAQRLKTFLHNSKLVAIVQFNPCKAEDRFFMNIHCKREGMTFLSDGRRVVKLAVEGTKFEPILDLYKIQQGMIFCPEPKVAQLLKVIKKNPFLILLAGIIEGQYASVSQFEEYNTLKDITTARAQLLSVLNSGGQNIVQSLNQHQTNFVSMLDQHVDIQKKETTTPTQEGKPTEEET